MVELSKDGKGVALPAALECVTVEDDLLFSKLFVGTLSVEITPAPFIWVGTSGRMGKVEEDAFLGICAVDL